MQRHALEVRHRARVDFEAELVEVEGPGALDRRAIELAAVLLVAVSVSGQRTTVMTGGGTALPDAIGRALTAYDRLLWLLFGTVAALSVLV